MDKLITIITVCFNSQETISRCIDSVVNQKNSLVEYIVIDGGSTDNTNAIIKGYGDDIDIFISEVDAGIYDAINKGIKNSSGKYIGILNSDDKLDDDFLSNFLSVISSNADFYYGSCIYVDVEYNYLLQSNPISFSGADVLQRMPFDHMSLYVKKDVLDKIGGYSLGYKLSSDLEFVNRLINHTRCSQKYDFCSGYFSLGGESGGINTFIESYSISRKYGKKRYLALMHMFNSILKMSITRVFGVDFVLGLKKIFPFIKSGRYQ